MTYFYDISEVVEQGRAASYEAKEWFRRLKTYEVTAGRLDHIERELRIALARVDHLRERCCEADATPEVSPAEFVREFGPSVS